MCRHRFSQKLGVRSNENVYTVKSMEPIFVICLFSCKCSFTIVYEWTSSRRNVIRYRVRARDTLHTSYTLRPRLQLLLALSVVQSPE